MNHRSFALASCLFLMLGCASKQVKQTEKVESATPAAQTPQAAKDAAPVLASAEVMQQILLKLKRIHFSFDSVDLLPDTREALLEAAGQLQKYKDIQLFIEGHADDRGTTEYNLALSERRARVVADFLANAGVQKERLVVVSKGEESPIAEGASQLAWAKNRRVEYRIKQGDVQFVLSEGTLFDDRGVPIPVPAEKKK